MENEMEKNQNSIQNDARDRALHCYGTAKVVEKRLRNLNRIDKIAKFLGLILPLSIGSFVVTVGTDTALAPKLLYISGILGAFQLIITLWSLIDNWSGKLEDYMESKIKNMYYTDVFTEIGMRYKEDEAKYANLFNDTKILDNIQQGRDHKINITEKERRFGMRHALFQFRQICAGCKKIPSLGKPIKCDVCGN